MHCSGYRKSATNGMQIDIKLINWVLTYENGVLRPFNKLVVNIGEVKMLLNNFRIDYTLPFSLKEELKKITLNKFKSWTCIIYYLLATPYSNTLKRSFIMKLINL